MTTEDLRVRVINCWPSDSRVSTVLTLWGPFDSSTHPFFMSFYFSKRSQISNFLVLSLQNECLRSLNYYNPFHPHSPLLYRVWKYVCLNSVHQIFSFLTFVGFTNSDLLCQIFNIIYLSWGVPLNFSYRTRYFIKVFFKFLFVIVYLSSSSIW